ncbi:dipeptidase PepV [Cytobacillus sp. FJAT-54145]|uniref:Dipeptidase PepV n=1 Tax=Cytobacillus spartinae TaxID=3299023 RepID=A0ABW6KC19_9BACI
MSWRDAVSKNEDLLIEDLSNLLKIKSVKDLSTKGPGAPMGENIKDALEFMLTLAEKDGFRTKNIDGYVGYAETGPEDASDYIALLCHLDVVPATGEWESDPFTPTIRDGKLFARGAIDDKGPTMAAYYALKIVKESSLSLKHRVRIIFGTDEESGMTCMKRYVQDEPAALTGFAPDAEFPIIHAEKGQINAILKLKDDKVKAGPYELVSFYAGEKGNMVPDRAEAFVRGKGLNKLKEKFTYFSFHENLQHSVEEKEDGYLFTLFGRSAHGMEPHKGVNAGTKLAKFFNGELSNGAYVELVATCLEGDHIGKSLNISFEDDVTGPLTVNPGIFRYTQNEDAYVALNIRCPVETPYLRTIEKLSEKVQEYGFEVEEVREKKPHHVEKESPVIKVLQNAYETETGLEPTLLTTGGATYARFIENGVAFGAVFPGKVNTAHQKNEYIELGDLFKATAVYARAIYDLANL